MSKTMEIKFLTFYKLFTEMEMAKTMENKFLTLLQTISREIPWYGIQNGNN